MAFLQQQENSPSLCDSILYLPTIGDYVFVGLLQLVGKETSPELQYVLIAMFAIYVVIVILWLPMFVLSMALGESGVYIVSVCSIVWLGRSIIRMIAFPGASTRVMADIQGEFAKHSMRCLEAASEELQELNQLVTATNGAQYTLEVSWKRVCMYRRRVIVVLLQVIHTLLQDGAPIFGCDQNYGNNPLVGEDLGCISPHAIDDAKALRQILSRILAALNKIEPHVKMCIAFNDSSRYSSSRAYQKFLSERIDSHVEEAAAELSRASMDLRDLLPSLHPDARSNSNGNDDDNQSRMSNLEAMQASVSSIIPFLDPPLYSSPFSLDVMRCCILSRYRGSKQFWVDRVNGGKIDCLLLPADSDVQKVKKRKKVVIYCNPNAGICEATSGVDFFGGNVGESDNECLDESTSWTDFYLNMGIDVVLFNYAGYGRSSENSRWRPSCLRRSRLGRIIDAVFFAFQPSPDSLKMDTLAVTSHIKTSTFDYADVIIHGESIGGMAAAGCASILSSRGGHDKPSLLICDRTFCNLEAVAQRLVGGWTANAIRIFAPFWNMDVAGDYLSASCPKIIASDAADVIIAYASSLVSGIAVSMELNKRVTRHACWIRRIPHEYRMAEWEDISIADYTKKNNSLVHLRPPTWPADRHISLSQAFYFAYATRRIGKLATRAKRGTLVPEEMFSNGINAGEGFEVMKDEEDRDEESCHVSMTMSYKEHVSTLVGLWHILARCDGLCGCPLGFVVKRGLDDTVTWLCNSVVFGGQQLVKSALKRGPGVGDSYQVNVQVCDFGDEKPSAENSNEPVSIPEVMRTLDKAFDEFCNDGVEGSIVSLLKDDISCVRKTLQYVMDRLSSQPSVESSLKHIHLAQCDIRSGQNSQGCLLNLRCGHNSMFSEDERDFLKALIYEAHQDLS